MYRSKNRNKVAFLSLVCCVVLFLITISVVNLLRTNGRDPMILPGHVGYVLAVHYSDQLTAGAANVYSLQCWAASLSTEHKKLVVVEPFVRDGSILGVNLGKGKFYGLDHAEPNSTLEEMDHTLSGDNTLRLRDIFDWTMWKARAYNYNYAPLISWKTFMENPPKKLILVDHTCLYTSEAKCMKCDNMFFNSKQFLKSATQFAREHDFTIVRNVCYSTSNIVSNKEFIDLVYGEHSIHESVVLFNHWGGIQTDHSVYRIPISNLKGCIRRFHVYYELRNSKQVVLDGEKYIRKFMP